MTIRPLNGENTHPLTRFALSTLRELLSGERPRQEINPGVCNRLLREALVEEVSLVSPYRTHKGRQIPFFRITAAGRAVLAEAAE